MKKVKLLLVSLISILAFNITVFAASANLWVSSGNVYVGDSFTVTANISSAAAWNVHVVSSGPVSGCTINQADASGDAMDTNKTFSATCTATGEGNISIRLSGDVTSATDGNAVAIGGTKTVKVSRKPAAPSNNNSGGNSNNVPNNSNVNSNQPVEEQSVNNNLKELTIDDHKLIKVDDNNYTLSVSNDVESININAIAEDSKATVSGTGRHDLVIGDNNIELIITSESGIQNKINIKVTRKDGYYLDDLESVLNSNKISERNIKIENDSKISSSDLEKIKNSKKTVKFNYYDKDKKMIYSWIVDGSKLKDTNEFITTISYDSTNKKEMLKLSNYADGIFIELKQKKNLLNGLKVKLYVGDKYSNKDRVNIYSYRKNDDELRLVNDKIVVQNGYIEFDVVDSSDYLITMSNIQNVNEVVDVSKEESNSNPILLFIIIFVGTITFLIVMTIIRKRKKVRLSQMLDSNNDIIGEEESISDDSDNYYNENDQNDKQNII